MNIEEIIKRICDENYPQDNADHPVPPEVLEGRKRAYDQNQANLAALNNLGRVDALLTNLYGRTAIKVDGTWFLRDNAGWRPTLATEASAFSLIDQMSKVGK